MDSRKRGLFLLIIRPLSNYFFLIVITFFVVVSSTFPGTSFKLSPPEAQTL
jgi:hypothetical protein